MTFARLGLIAVLLLLAWTARASAAAIDEAPLFEAVAARLALMRDVAAFKARTGRPVEDQEREAVVLDRAVAGAVAAGLEATTVREFFRAQIDAAKIIQYRYRAEWLAYPDRLEGDPPDLAAQVRPALGRLGDEIVVRLRARLQTGPLPARPPPDWHAALAERPTVAHLDPSDRDRLYDALRRVRVASD